MIALTLLGFWVAPYELRSHFQPQAQAAVTFTVTNTNDSGAGSLRQAIVDANANAGTDLITFSIGSGLQTIAPSALLPDITDPVIIDGTTQAGFAGTPLIELSGLNAPSLPNVGLLTIKGGNTTIRGLILNHAKDFTILIVTVGGNHIEGNYIGTDATGNLTTNSNGNLITINDSPNNTIGGTTPEMRNVISGSGFHGISIFGVHATGNVIQGNFIGTNAAGNSRLGNFSGIFLGSSNNFVGGAVPEARNVISANNYAGIVMQVNGTGGNVIQGNFIGTDATGTVNLGNTNYGVAIFDSSNNTIGGSIPGAGNVISGNGWGVSIASSSGTPIGNIVQGNYIGVAADGTSPLGNRVEGLRISGAINTIVGGPTTQAENIVAFNGPAAETGVGTGIEVLVGTGNSITGNSVFSNGRLGLDLANDGLTANDLGDSDSGPNNRQNFPLITSVVADAAQTTIAGSLNSSPNSTFQISFYANSACDPSGNGEGAIPFGSTSAVTDASGNAQFSVVVTNPLGPGKVITAMATDSAGNTSEFSPCDVSQAAGNAQLSNLPIKAIEDVGLITINVVRNGGSHGPLSVEYSTRDVTALAGQDYVATSGTLVFNDGETTKSFDVPILDDAITEPDETFLVRLRNGTNVDSIGPVNEQVITLQDHDVPPVLTINSVSINEPDGGSVPAMLTVSLSPMTGRTVTVNYSTSGGNATSGVDFQPASGMLVFGPRVTSQNVQVLVNGDQIDEFNETFNITLGSAVGATVGNIGTVTIVDNDPPPSVSIADAIVTEGTGGANTVAQFGLSLSAPSGKSVCVQASTADQTATANSDYAPYGNGLTNPPAFMFFNPGTTTATLSVQIFPDAIFEPTETFLVNLVPCNSDVTVNRGQAIGTILNDDPLLPPSISITDVAVTDGNGSTNAVFAVTLSQAASQTVSVKFASVSGTAASGVDFQPVSGMLTFSPGATSQNISVPIVGDSLSEPNETFTIDLSEPVNATIADAQGLCTISDGPPSQLPTLSINDITVLEGDDGTSTVDFTVTLSHSSDQQVTFYYTTVPGTATEAMPGHPITGTEDYSWVSGTQLIFGGTSRRISVPIYGDHRCELDETFFVNISNATNATIADSQGLATILDNDPPHLFTDASNHVIAIDSVTFVRDPFSVVGFHNFSSDQHTRVMIFTNLGLTQPSADLSVTAGGIPLTIEAVGTLGGAPDTSYIVVKLDPMLTGNVSLTVTFHGAGSNTGILSITP
jgi:Calx-beta domain-containing protein